MSGGPHFESIRAECQGALRKALKSKSLDVLENKMKLFTNTDTDLKTPLDQAFRDMLLEHLQQEVKVSVLKDFVSFCIESCRRGLTSPTLPVMVLGDIFEALTLDVCQEMFLFVEDNVDVLKEELFFSACKNHLLRLCNDLLRRLSRSTATVFCGRILLFLARFFPFSERSGLNIVSEFNLENITEYGNDAAQEDFNKEIDMGDKPNMVIDFTLYYKFWSLQDFFRCPVKCYDKVQWKAFSVHATCILNTFQGLKLEYAEKSTNVKDERKDTMYFSKYLTSQKLLDLQLYDNNFRRFVLIQFLILFQYLTSTVKFKSESFELKTDQKEWIQNTTEKVFKLLRETPPNGKKFADVIQNILEREEFWNAWKNDGCPEFKKPSSGMGQFETKSQKPQLLGELIQQASSEGKYYLGSPELTKLWNLNPDNLEACKGKERDFLPSLEEYFAEAIQQLEPGSSIKEEDKIVKDTNFGWRALRLLARKSPHFFTYSTTIMNQLSLYIETMIKKIAHDQKGKIQESNSESQQLTEEVEDNLFKESEDNDTNEEMKQEAEADEDYMHSRNETKNITPAQLQFLSSKISEEWKKVATKLGFKPDEIQFFTSENPTVEEQARNMLQLWFEDDEDANVENFIYILEGLDMQEAADIIKNEFKLNN